MREPSKTSLLHLAIKVRLAPIVSRFGFVPADETESVDGADVEIVQLGYRLEWAESRILLDFCCIAGRRTVNATLWSPAGLAPTEDGVESVAMQQRTWPHEADVEPDDLAAEIIAEVETWLERAPWAR